MRRLRRTADLERVLKEGCRRRSEYLEMIVMDNSAGLPRMGLIVPKYQFSAVARNRLRRRLKEIWRREIQAVQGPRDVVIRTRRAAYQAAFSELRADALRWRDDVFPKR